MAKDLVEITTAIAPIRQDFPAMLAGAPFSAERFVAALEWEARRIPKLRQCESGSLMEFAMTCVDLRLLPGSAKGQIFAIPFKDRKNNILRAQTIIGYKGYNTLGHYQGLVIDGDVVREGDDFDYVKGTSPSLSHRRKQGNKNRIVRAWACATNAQGLKMIAVVELDELEELKRRAEGKGDFSPWNDAALGYAGMCAKTPKRRLARSMPLGVFVRAAMMEQAFEEEGKHSYITRGEIVTDDGKPSRQRSKIAPKLVEAQPEPQPDLLSNLGKPRQQSFEIRMGKSRDRWRFTDNIEDWRLKCEIYVKQLKRADHLETFREIMGPIFDEYAEAHGREVTSIVQLISQRLGKT